jgi:DNA sulfur modification protein DndD
MGSNSVIRKFKSKITGDGMMYDSLENDRMRIEHMIEKEQEHVKNIDINIKNYQKKCDEIEQYLEENKSTEMLQGKLKNLQIVREEQRKRANISARAF